MSKIQGFAYVSLKEDIRAIVKKSAGTVRGLLEKSGAAVVEIGDALIEVRGLLSAKEWTAWLAAEFRWGQATASQYMSAARQFGDRDCLRFLQPYAMFQLSRKATPQAAVEEAVKLAEDKQLVTGKVARELIAKHGGRPQRADAGQPRKADGNPLETFQRALAGLGSVETLVGKISEDERDALADRLQQLARQLRAGGTARLRDMVTARRAAVA
jgi:hypothetical protein